MYAKNRQMNVKRKQITKIKELFPNLPSFLQEKFASVGSFA